MNIEEIWEYYHKDLQAAEEHINDAMKTVAPAIASVGGHLFASGGKRIRPFLAIVSAKLLGYDGDNVNTLACSVECIHTASLLHDDVVDGANIRRGKPAAHSVWGNQVVILVGDFLYANALRLANLLHNQNIMDALCTATASMSEGELVQLSKKADPDMNEEDYMKVIRGKTAVLMSAACRGGAVLGSAVREQEQAMETFGLNFGYAFQITDDILDYTAQETESGKSLGKDLEEGKITLPLIYLLRDADPHESQQIREIIRGDHVAETDLAYVNHLFRKHGSIEKSFEKADGIISEAKSCLELFGDSREKESLLTVADYILARQK